MNICKNDAGYVNKEHILNSGFKVVEVIEYHDWIETTYQKDGKLFIEGGYWEYRVKDIEGKTLWKGWPNSNEEFDEVIKEIESRI